MSWPVGGILSCLFSQTRVTIPLSSLPGGCRKLPFDERAVRTSRLTLLRVGFTEPTCCHAAGALLPHRFILTCDWLPSPSAVCFLLHFPSGRPASSNRAPCPVESRPSSTELGPAAVTRPTHRDAKLPHAARFRVVRVQWWSGAADKGLYGFDRARGGGNACSRAGKRLARGD